MMHRYRQRIGCHLGLLLALLAGLLHAPLALTQERPTASAQTTVPLRDTYPFYQDEAIALAVSYLQSQQQPNGGINAFGFGAHPGGTARAVYALAALGYPVTRVAQPDGTTMMDFLATQAISYTYANATPTDDRLLPGAAGLVLGAVAAAEADPTSFAGVNYVAAIQSTLRPSGAYSTTAQAGMASGAASAINQSLAIFGLVAAGQPVPQAATDWLIGQQADDGSWFGGSVDVTGYGMLALLGSGNVAPTDAPIQRAIAFLRRQQTTRTALWNDAGTGGEPANSSSWAMTALATAGYMPLTASWATPHSNPQTALLALQDAEGNIAQNFQNAYATLEAFYGLTAQPLYLARPARTNRALSWLAAQQNPDGGWPLLGRPSDPGATLDGVLAFAAAGYNPASVTAEGASPVDYLAATAAAFTRDTTGEVFPARLGKLLVAVAAVGAEPASFGGLDARSELAATLRPTGAYSTTATQGFARGAASPFNQSLAMLGLAAVGAPLPASATDYLIRLQANDGSWGNVESTGIALQALAAAGVAPDHPAMVAAITFLRASQLERGGWASGSVFSTTATAYAIQGLQAAGVDLAGADWLTHGRWPPGVLGSYQKPDGPFAANWHYAGASRSFNPTADNLLATQHALPALLGTFYPYAAIAPAALTAFVPIARGPDPDRTVLVAPTAAFGPEANVQVQVPIGSDLNGDSTLALAWRSSTGTQEPLGATRAVGMHHATLSMARNGLTARDRLAFQVTVRDPDGVQVGSTLRSTATLGSSLAPQRILLPHILTPPR